MASKAVGLLTFNFGANMAGFNRAMKKAQIRIRKFGKQMIAAGRGLTLGLTLPIVALGVASVRAFDAQQKAIAQVEAGLKSTGNQVGITSEKLQEMAADLQTKTLFGDEEILKDATAQLLTFTNIAGEQFERTQLAALDLASRLDGDLKSSSIMLGKALNDPVANLSALSRAGIQFSKDQKKTVKTLVQTNRLADAQTLILNELEKQYGGSAAAAAAAGSGPITQLKNQLSDMSEEIGKRIVPKLIEFVKWITSLATKFDNLSDKQKDNIVFWIGIVATVGPLLIIFGKLAIGISAVMRMFSALSKFLSANPYIALAAAVVIVAAAVYKLSQAFKTQVDAQKTIAGVEAMASRATASDITNIKLLTGQIEDETTSLDEKRKALNKLQKAYPGYYTEIDNSFKSTAALTKETNRLTTTLMDNAMMNAAKSQIEETYSTIMDLEAEMAGSQENWTEIILGWKTQGGALLRDIFHTLDEHEIKNLKQKLKIYEKLYKKYHAKVEAGSPMPGVIETVKHKKTVILDLDGETPEEKAARLKTEGEEAEVLAKQSLKNIAQLEQEYALITEGINDGILKKKHKQSILALEQQKQNLLDEVAATDTAEKEKQAIKDLYDEKIKQQRAENKTEAEEAVDESITKWETYFKKLEEGFNKVMDIAGQLFSSLGGVLDSLGSKQDAIFANWKKNEEDKIAILDEQQEQARERIENSLMSEQEKTDALIAMEEDFGDKKKAINTAISDEADRIAKKQAKRNKAMAIADAIMGTATAVVNALGSAAPPLNFILAGIVGALGAVQIANIIATPIPMAKGGLITGPTTALIGEGLGTTASNPEVVAPLDRLKTLIGGEGIEVFGRISGTDIVLSSKQTNINRLRSI